jgi:hypothetical protein
MKCIQGTLLPSREPPSSSLTSRSILPQTILRRHTTAQGIPTIPLIASKHAQFLLGECLYPSCSRDGSGRAGGVWSESGVPWTWGRGKKRSLYFLIIALFFLKLKYQAYQAFIIPLFYQL